jgi:hypothetical protein
MQILQNKKIIILFIICCVGVFGYFTFFNSPTSDEKTGGSNQLVGQDILDLVQSLQRVSIDPSLFSGPFFKNLKDFTTPVIPEEQGRTNPFGSLQSEVNASKKSQANTPKR